MRRKQVYDTTVQSVERTLDIIETLSEYKTGVGVTTLSKELKLHKSTVHRLLTTLMLRKYVEQDGETSKYKLGMRLFELGNAVLSKLDIRQHAMPYLRQLWRTTGETIQLAIVDQFKVLYVDVLETLERVGVKSNVGERVPLHCSAPGKIWLATLPDERLGEVLKLIKFEPFTPYTIENVEKLKLSIAQAKENGYAVDNQENSADLVSVAAAVRNYRGRVIACVAITAPALRMSEDRVKEMGFNVKSTAEKISQSMGYNK
ncbi:MAG TPA: IclR family transcriptional regulator [Candidatus Goldiibacteriota bacterium]|nr:IclR family transcriptional regulator [Candidatus Goldiibacteriota bacterium]